MNSRSLQDVINTQQVIASIIEDMRKGVSIPVISARFHNGLADACLDICSTIRNESGTNRVALSGGVWQNTTLLMKTLSRLRSASFETFIHHRVPTNDGGISIGQILITAAAMQNK